MSTPNPTIPSNLTLGRANWVWSKMHAQRFTGEEALDVTTRFCKVNYLRAVPHEGHFILCNSAGCWVHSLIADNAPCQG